MCLFVQCIVSTVISNPTMLFMHVYILNIYMYLSNFIYPLVPTTTCTTFSTLFFDALQIILEWCLRGFQG